MAETVLNRIINSRVKKSGIGDNEDWNNQEEGLERGSSDPYEEVVNKISDIFATHDVLMKSEFEQINKDLDTAGPKGMATLRQKDKVQKEI